MPQGAVVGWPGHTGQTSFAARSQTVKMKSIRGSAWPGELVPTLAAKASRGEVRRFQLPQRLGANASGGMTAGTEGGEGRMAFLICNGLGHDRARRVPGA
jgi:hypothetical protein